MNEKVATDLKSWKGKYILYIINIFTRLGVSVFINQNTTKRVSENILQHWIDAGWGVMEGNHFDEMHEMASLLNIINSTPGASR